MLPQILPQVFDKTSHLGGQVQSLEIDSIDICWGSLVIGEYLDQTATAQVLGHVPLCPHQDAMSIQRPVQRDFAVIGAELAIIDT